MIRITTRDVTLGDGRTLRVGLEEEPDGAKWLHLAVGAGEGASWREDPAEGLTVPASVVSPLVLALLEVGDEVP